MPFCVTGDLCSRTPDCESEDPKGFAGNGSADIQTAGGIFENQDAVLIVPKTIAQCGFAGCVFHEQGASLPS